MKRRRAAAVGISALLGLALLAVGLTRLRQPPAEDQIRAQIAKFESGLEAGRMADVMDVISRRFSGQDVVYTDVMRGLYQLRRDAREVHLYTQSVTVNPHPDGQTADITALVAFWGRGSFGEFSFGQDHPVTVQARFVREGRTWRAIWSSGFPTPYWE